ncbi:MULTISPECIES: FAD-binding oxidoreductase [Haloferax]|uniref:FAD-dependent oxidoreductase n=2 Tax=Haloferax TaxID=2251 RepID=A0A6G1Z5U5_9EURY|nr:MULTISPECIES: FAD-binding oxidoreductase [Haloferax]KAB1185367.1 FAD-binding oxidoreductase [Haloferax sp. CBA1149]MRW82007.1 FAD-dependent oxidoreductase [Haloferax marinisediminis]
MAYDYIVVGGGVYGAGTAWELASRGEDVLLLEAEEIASGASGGLGKRGVRANGRDLRELPLMNLAYDLWPTLSDRIGAETGYERTGHLRLFERETGGLQGGFASAQARANVQNEFGVETEVLTGDAVRELEPELSDDVVGALYCPNDGVADQTATTRGLAAAAAELGATIREHTPVRGVERDGDRVTALVTDEERFEVEKAVLLLSNAHVPKLVESELGITLPVWETFPQVSATEPMDEAPVNHLIGHDHRRLALKVLSDNRVMISGGWRGEWDDDTNQAITIDERVQGNAAEARAVFPVLEDVQLETADASRRETATVDHIPIIDTLPGATNMIIGTGWTGHGFAISLAVNQLLATWAIEGERPRRLAPFSTDRFSKTGLPGL